MSSPWEDLLPPGTVRGRWARAVAAAVRSIHPSKGRRGDIGRVAEALTGRYPYKRWLRLQRRRRAAQVPKGATATVVVTHTLAGELWEPDAERVLSACVAPRVEAVQFHVDAPSACGRTPRILGSLGPVTQRLRYPLGPGVLLTGERLDELDTAEVVRSLDPASLVRVDEVLLHTASPLMSGPGPVDRPPDSPDAVAVVVPSPGSVGLLETLFTGLTHEENVAEVVVVDNSPPSGDATRFYGEWKERLPLEILRTDPGERFNWSRANNLGAAATSAPVLAFCNDDLEFTSAGTLARLAGWLSVDGVGVVGPQLRYPDGSIQHGGVVIGLNGLAEHAFVGMEPGSDTLIGNTDDPRDVSAVTGASLVTTRVVHAGVGGFDEELAVTGSDVWFCLQARKLGLGTAYDGSTAVIHHESVTRGTADHLDDVISSEARWGEMVDRGDPYWSQLLAIHRHEPTLRLPGDPTSREMLDAWFAARGVTRSDRQRG